jgi:type VI secretion system protein ImpK
MANDMVITLDDTAQLGSSPTITKIQAPRAFLSAERSHYRSKIYSVKLGTNPLVAAASGLLTLLFKLQQVTDYPDLEQLYFNLIHEIKAFESLAQSHHYRAETIVLARYALASALDETILNTPWGKISSWSNHKLLTYFQHEEWGGDRFFIILERLTDDPMLHIDLLELLYFCLSSGYEGKFRFQEQGHQQLWRVIDGVFQKIKQYRIEMKPELNLLAKPLPRPVRVKRSWLPLKLFLASCLLSLTFAHIGINGLYQWTSHGFLRDISVATAS